MSKKAAIYDRWLASLGGGEQVAFAYAETLRDLGYETHLLTHDQIDVDKATSKMNVDLTGIKIKYLPHSSTKELSRYTEKYDVFINTSYLDYFPNRSKFGILSVFFPDKMILTPIQYLKRSKIIPSLRKFFIYPVKYEGFSFDEYKDRRIFKWFTQKASIIFKQRIKKFSITIYIEDFSFSFIDQIEFSYGRGKIKPISRNVDHKSNTITWKFYSNKKSHLEGKKFNIILPKGTEINNIALIKLTIPSLRYYLYNLFKTFFPKWEMRLHGGPEVTKLSDLESYDLIVTISDFCKKWIKDYWRLPSKVLYPPVNTSHFKPAKKKNNWIIHVGRFFVTGHNKKQLDMVKVFKKLINQEKVKDWQLHFIGSVEEGPKHHQYFKQTVFEARNYPIHFHTDVSFSELKKLLSKSKIYWHATGLDENEEKDPILFEHFGITTVEAMASGCVPVVIKAGGQKEIVTSESGMLWNNRQEWLKNTAQLISNPQLLKKMSKAAVKRSKFFDRKNFKKNFKQLLEKS